MELAEGQVPRRLAPRRRLRVEKQSAMETGRVLGSVHAANGDRAGLPSAQKRTIVATGMASLQRSHRGTCLCLRVGLCSVEDARSSVQTGGTDDGNSEA